MAHNNMIVIDGAIVIGDWCHDAKAAQEKNAEDMEITRDEAVGPKYTANWPVHARHSEPSVGRGVAR